MRPEQELAHMEQDRDLTKAQLGHANDRIEQLERWNEEHKRLVDECLSRIDQAEGLLRRWQSAEGLANIDDDTAAWLTPEGTQGKMGHGYCMYGHDILTRNRCRYGHDPDPSRLTPEGTQDDLAASWGVRDVGEVPWTRKHWYGDDGSPAPEGTQDD